MRRPIFLAALALSTGLGLSSAVAQDSLVTPPAHHPRLRGASKRELFLGSMAGGAVFASGGMLLSGTIDSFACNRHHRDDPPPVLWFGPCFLPSGGSMAIGWIGGSFVGSAATAATVAAWRGCPKRQAIARSIAGAAVGSATGWLAYSAGRRSDRYPAARTWQIALTPIFSGLGSAVAVVGCHRS